MKVLHLLDTVDRGGIEILTLDVCRNANRNGLDLIFAACGNGALDEDFANSGVDYFRLKRRLPVDPLLIRELRALILKHDIDIVHSHLAVAGLHAYLAALGTNAKNVLTFHGFYSTAKERMSMNFLIPRMSANISCSNSLLDWLVTEKQVDSSKNFSVIYNGVDPRRLEYKGDDLRTELGLPDDSLMFGMVANFYVDRRKDQATLCKAFASLAHQVPNTYLIFAGTPESGAEAKYEECVDICRLSGILDRVFFLGRRNDIQKIISSLDIYVMSSFHEGLPIALIEAMLSKKPCIVSDIEPHIEASGNGEFAEVFETGQPIALFDKMMAMSLNSSLRDEFAARAYEHASREFSIESHISKLKLLYESILNS